MADKDTNEEFKELFSYENADKVAKYVVDMFGNDEDESRVVDYDFNYSEGKVVGKDTNTSFKFDTNKGTLLDDMKNTISDDKVKPTEENIIIFDDFRDKVCELLENKYKSNLLGKVRKVVMNDIPSDVMPMDSLRIDNFEITDKPSSDYVIVVQKDKRCPRDVRLNEVVYRYAEEEGKDPLNVIDEKKKEVEAELEEKDMDILDIIAEKQKEDENCDKYYFYFINDAYKRKYWFNCQVDMFVDYSLNEVETPPAS